MGGGGTLCSPQTPHPATMEHHAPCFTAPILQMRKQRLRVSRPIARVEKILSNRARRWNQVCGKPKPCSLLRSAPPARKQETQRFCLTPRLSLQLYYIPLLAPEVLDWGGVWRGGT